MPWFEILLETLQILQLPFQYRQAMGKPTVGGRLPKNASSRSFQAFGFGAQNRSGEGNAVGSQEDTSGSSSSLQARRGSHINVNVAPTIMENDTPEIRKYKKRFNSDILCAALWGKQTNMINYPRVN